MALSGGFAYTPFLHPTGARILAIHGPDDRRVPISSILRLKETSPDSVQLIESDGHQHGAPNLAANEKPRQGLRRIAQFIIGDNRTASAERDMGNSDQVLPEYKEIIVSQGVRIPFVPQIITPNIERPLRNSRYEGGECATARKIIRPGDRVLELGGGLGLVSTICALEPGTEHVTCVEANPELVPLIRETHRLNGVSNVTIINAVATRDMEEPVTFYQRADFWASSMEPASRPYRSSAIVPARAIASLLSEVRPTILIADIEGAELGLLDEADLDGLRAILFELHPKVYGDEGVQSIVSVLAEKGFVLDEDSRGTGSVKLFVRPEPAAPLVNRPARDWGAEGLRVVVPTCMKDEGPFILEWIAWNRAIGVTDFVVFSNDCTDGTDAILDRLDEMGIITHLPNPAFLSGSHAFQPMALSYVSQMHRFRRADFVISMDVDEFINIRCGDGTLAGLFAETGAFDVLSMSEINHGSNRQEHYAPGWMTETFPGHQSERPGAWKAHRGVKSIVRLSDRLLKLRNHRPDMAPEARWLNGSGQETSVFHDDAGANGTDCRNAYKLVSLDHFPLRSAESFLVKMFRGDVVVKNKSVSERYWRVRDDSSANSSDLAAGVARARAVFERDLAHDEQLMRLHAEAERAHIERIRHLMQVDRFQSRLRWIRDGWDSGQTDAVPPAS